jgi:hypothetical protein
MSQEIYKSTTHGNIPLSFEGRRLLQNLRYAATAAIENGFWRYDDNALSKARGELALYMSKLEARRETPTSRFIVDLRIYCGMMFSGVVTEYSDGTTTNVRTSAEVAKATLETWRAGLAAGERKGAAL